MLGASTDEDDKPSVKSGVCCFTTSFALGRLLLEPAGLSSTCIGEADRYRDDRTAQ